MSTTSQQQQRQTATAAQGRNQPTVRNRVPHLAEVLRRNTRPPVDLYCYYLFLQREGSEDTLDFWLDVQQHENLCRAYFKDLQKAGVAVSDDWPQYARYARTRGSIYGNVTGIRRGEHDASPASASSAYGGEDESAYGSGPRTPYFDSPTEAARDGLAEEKGRFEGSSGVEKPLPSPTPSAGGLLSPATSDYGFAREQLRTPSPQPGQHVPQYPLSPTLRAMYPHDDDDYAGGRSGEFGAASANAAAAAAEAQHPGSGNTLTSTTRRRLGAARRSNTNGSVGNTQPFIMRSSAISRTDLIASAERIFTRYLMPGADKEVYLPPSLRITDFPLSRSTLPAVTHPDYDHEASLQAQIPDLFHQQKEFVYRAMEQDSFPRFLRSKAYGNLTPLSAYARLAFGLLALWAAFATGFAFILLDVTPKAKRLWVILPFTFAIVNIVAWGYDLDPLMVFMGLSETTPFRTIGIREPYIRKLLFARALWIAFLSAVIVAVLTLIFVLVPGHRL